LGFVSAHAHVSSQSGRPFARDVSANRHHAHISRMHSLPSAGHCACGGGCPRCAEHPKGPVVLRRQLRFGEEGFPGETDHDEEEETRHQPGLLPYREATELSECIRIMGPENMSYCREAVLRERPSPPPPAVPEFPTATFARFVTSGPVRCCNDVHHTGQCPPHLGPAVPGDPQPQNGMNLVFRVDGHRPGIQYRFVQRIEFQRCIRWAPVNGGNWELLDRAGPGHPDSPVRNATCPIPNANNEITMMDAPGFQIALGGSGTVGIDEITVRMNASNWVIAREGRGPWRRISGIFHWFSTTRIRRNAAGVMELSPGANRIGAGSCVIGGCVPPPP
jgi:hypothetical protein